MISAEATRPRWSFVEISSNQAEIQNLNPPSQKRCNTQLVAVSNQAGSGKSRVAAVRWWSCSTAELQRAAPTRLCSLLSTPEQNSGRLPPLSFPVRCFDQKIPCSTLKVDFAYDCLLRQQHFVSRLRLLEQSNHLDDETSYFKLGAVGKGLNWTMSNSIGGHLTSEGLLMASFISGGLSDCVPLSH